MNRKKINRERMNKYLQEYISRDKQKNKKIDKLDKLINEQVSRLMNKQIVRQTNKQINRYQTRKLVDTKQMKNKQILNK